MRSTTGAVPACGNGSIRCRQLFWIAALLRLADVQFDEERLAAIDKLPPVRRIAMKFRNSALPDAGDFLKRRSVQPAGRSAFKFFEQSLSTQSRPSTCSEAAVRFPPQHHQQQSALFQQRLELLNRYRLAKPAHFCD
jgi:hypothetical protein